MPTIVRDPRLRKAIQIAVSLALVVFIFWYVLRQFADLSQIWDAMRTLTPLEIGGLVVAAGWNLVTYWILNMIATPGLTFSQSMVMTESTTAVSNSVPAGGAVGVGLTYSMLGSWGFSKSRTTLSLVVSGIWNNFAKLGMPIVALAILAAQGEPGGGRLVAAVAGLAGLVGAIVVFASSCVARNTPGGSGSAPAAGCPRSVGWCTRTRSRGGTWRSRSSGAGSSGWCANAGHC